MNLIGGSGEVGLIEYQTRRFFFSCRGRDGWDAPESDMWLVNRRLTSHNRTKAESATNRAPPTHQPVEEQYGGYGH